MVVADVVAVVGVAAAIELAQDRGQFITGTWVALHDREEGRMWTFACLEEANDLEVFTLHK